jgi:hypothetical protein
METLELYVVKNSDGKYFRAKGYGHYGHSWVDDIKQARIYAKLSPARSQVTFWANNYSQYGTPVILKLTATVTEILDEVERVKKANEKRVLAEKSQKISEAKRKMENARRDMERAKQDMENARIILNNPQ